MPKIVKLPKGKAFEFKKAATASKYAWDAWFAPEQGKDGKPDQHGTSALLQLCKGTDEQVAKGEADYAVDTEAMGPKIKTAARKRYKVVSVSSRDFDGKKLEDAVIIQARDMTADEKIAEDVKRAEEKANAKAAKEENDDAPPDLAVAEAPEAGAA